MASHDGNGNGAGGSPDPSAPLPPELDPRGRRHAKREQREQRRQNAQSEQPDQGAQPHQDDRADQADQDQDQDRQGEPGPSSPLVGRRDFRHGLGVGVRAVVAALAAAVLVVSGWAWLTYHDFRSNIRRVDAISGVDRPARDVDGKDQNLLVVGNDDRDTATNAELKALGTTRDGGSYNTDTMMLIHLPANGQKATVISFPRDSYVAIPGHGMSKLNSAYPDGMNDHHGDKTAGAQLLVETIENLTGLTIDHFVQVDLLGFYRISNAIGGVPVDLCKAQKEPNSGIDLPAGWSKIEGKQALAFVRQRYGLPNGDLDRIKRQQYFLSSAFRTVSSAGTLLNPFKLQHLLKAVSNSLQMDRTLDPLQLAEQFQNLSAGNLIFKTIPTHGTEDTDAGNVVVVRPPEVKRFAEQLAGTKSSSEPQVSPSHSPQTAAKRPLAAPTPTPTPSNGMTAAQTARGCIN